LPVTLFVPLHNVRQQRPNSDYQINTAENDCRQLLNTMSEQPNINDKEDVEKIQKDATDGEDIVNPWEVKAESMTGVDYDKIISELFIELIFYEQSLFFFE
jgi:hypothetical protein